MEKSSYTLKKYVGNSEYTHFDFPLEDIFLSITLNPEQRPFLDEELNGALTVFDKVSLPSGSYNNLKSLLSHFDLSKHLEFFLLLIANTQNYYILYSEINDGPLMEDFMFEKKDMKKFIRAIEKNMKEGDAQSHSISFKFNNETITINNFFILADIFRALRSQYHIEQNNLDEIKESLLADSDRFKFEKGSEYIKSKAVQYVHDCFKQIAPERSQNQILKFCGVFLHIAEIPSNNNRDEILIGEIDDALNIIDHDNIRHYLYPRSSYYR